MRNTDSLKFWSLGQSFEYHQQFIGEGNSNPLQYSCLRNPTDRGAWWATVHGVTELDTTEQLSIHRQQFIDLSVMSTTVSSDNSKMLPILIHPNFIRFILNYSLFFKVCSLVTASKNHSFVGFFKSVVMLFSMKFCTFIFNPYSNPKRISYPKISAFWTGVESGRLFWKPSWCWCCVYMEWYFP